MSKNYCIFRTAKLKSHQEVTNILKEQHRADDYEAERADNSLSYRNSYSCDFETAMKNYNNLLPKKIRKNAVVGLNFVVSTSEEFSNEVEESLYYDKSRRFIEKHFGKIVGWAIHRDENSTHMQVVTIPLKDGKLNARELIGGDKHRMQRIQTDFWAEVGNEFGLSRGEENSKTKHKTVEQKHREEQAEIDRQKEQIKQKEHQFEEREKSLLERENGLLTRSKALDDKETLLALKETQINACVQYARDNSLDLIKEFDKVEKNRFYIPDNFPNFIKKVKDTLTGAWFKVKSLSEKLEETKKKLENWREKSADELFELAQKYRIAGVKNWTEYEKKQQQKKKQRYYEGFSLSD